ncbi:hypothetical protein CRI94_14260 [Longibacter salinarum]|uniref:Uncharacterized protein n=1 Tax=Longibacter salinarum TaxID=1850348 RepID=A0A2A8CVN3_9BACT|nr:hypothetical protein [Longibacter salinarum]PEN12673.1 hypothetical protein CRI94_14260 [Longibacter salinarum]
MRISELKRRLAKEHFNPNAYSLDGAPSLSDDRFHLEEDGGVFKIFYVERGKKEQLLGAYEDESDACDAFYDLLRKVDHAKAHMVGFFEDVTRADTAATLLEDHAIDYKRDSIPYGGPNDPRHRLFVFGADVIRAEKLLDDNEPKER